MIGIDIEQISRFSHWTETEFKRIFSENEIKYANQFENRIEHFCGFFCVKEAFVKALDDDGVSYSQIEVSHTESGKPEINLTPYIKKILREHGANEIEISISHTRDYACAVVLVK